jgi:hypothetical protein
VHVSHVAIKVGPRSAEIIAASRLDRQLYREFPYTPSSKHSCLLRRCSVQRVLQYKSVYVHVHVPPVSLTMSRSLCVALFCHRRTTMRRQARPRYLVAAHDTPSLCRHWLVGSWGFIALSRGVAVPATQTPAAALQGGCSVHSRLASVEKRFRVLGRGCGQCLYRHRLPRRACSQPWVRLLQPARAARPTLQCSVESVLTVARGAHEAGGIVNHRQDPSPQFKH